MKQFTIFIYSNSVNAVYNAYCFAQFASTAYVFFWRDSVIIANRNIALAGDELNLQELWQKFSIHNNIPLYVCKASALRRGINEENLAKQFIFGTMGELSQNLSAYKLMSF